MNYDRSILDTRYLINKIRNDAHYDSRGNALSISAGLWREISVLSHIDDGLNGHAHIFVRVDTVKEIAYREVTNGF